MITIGSGHVFPASTTLRKRLLVVVVGVFVLLTTAVAGASVFAMNVVLTQQVDTVLHSTAARIVGAFDRGGGLGPNGPDNGPDGDEPSTPASEADVLAALVTSPGIPQGTILATAVDRSVLDCWQLDKDGTATLLGTAATEALSGVDAWNTQTVVIEGHGAYRVTEIVLNQEQGLMAYVGVSMADSQQTMLWLVLVIGTSAMLAAILAWFLGDSVVRRALRPLNEVVETTERISELPLETGEVELTERVPVSAEATEVGRVGSSVNRMLNHIESAFEARAESERKVRQFVADASHELRTPLAAIRGYAEITRRHESDLPENAQVSLERIESAADRMTTLVNDLLLLARLDEGREVELVPTDLTSLVIESVSDAQVAGRGHPIDLDVPDEPVDVVGDRMRLQQVIANLLANARVHTPEGTKIEVGLHTTASEAIITVRDSGPGIPLELQATLFERFVRGDQSRSRKAGSSGLGLAIVRAIVRAHEGEITVASEPGNTEFTLRLPLSEPRAPETVTADEPKAESEQKRRGIRFPRTGQVRRASVKDALPAAADEHGAAHDESDTPTSTH